MNLHRTITKFMTDTFVDPYDSTSSIKGAVKVFNEVTNSGPSSRRRILETEPGVTLFTNRVVKRDSEIFLVGAANADTWRGEALRNKYPILPVDRTVVVATLAQILAPALPTRVTYSYPHYTKSISLDLQESEQGSNFTLFFSTAEAVAKGQIVIFSGNSYYRVRNDPYVDGAGFQVASAVLLSTPLQTLTLSRVGGYDVTLDTVTAASTASVSAFVEDAYLSYDHTSERFAQIKPGDKTITVRPSLPPKVGDSLGAFKILSVDPGADDVSVCHCRR